MKRKTFLPFGWLPGHWGLKGEIREMARIEYEYADSYIKSEMLAKIKYAGVDLDNKLNQAQYVYGLIDEYEYEKKRIKINFSPDERHTLLLDLDLTHNKITNREYEYAMVDIIEDVKTKQTEKLKLDLKHQVITQREYDKLLADINNESWVSIVNIDHGGQEDEQGGMPSIELDWNDKFIEELREAGYKGKSDEEVANDWLVFLCRNVALQDLSGVGDFEDMLEYKDMESWEKTRQEMGIETVSKKGKDTE